MKRIALATTALLTLSPAAPAFANDQLAASLGVAGQGLSTAELVELKSAADEGNAARINAVLLKAGATASTASTKSFGGTDAKAQLAASLGVNAADYSLSELVALKSAVDSDDVTRINAITSHATKGGVSNPEARAQLGYSEGMDPATSSLADMVKSHSS